MVFYRKYRPQKISELDSEQIRTALTAILGVKDVPHAFLFYGPKGLGKTSAARIVAKIVNCERLVNKRLASSLIEPCNKCHQCTSITNGTNLDVLEIDAASNRGIDEIRDLREKIKLAPVRAHKKIYIIDEVHMLTREAFNALLKTLEEPPSHIMFILCTTEPEKLPETIASRCFTVNFKRADEEEIIRSLSRIIKKESISIDKNVVVKVAKMSDGSFRDGAKILEQMRALAGKKKITSLLLEKEYQSYQQTLDFLESLSKKDVKTSLLLLEKKVKEGMDVKTLIEQILYSLHELILARLGIKDTQIKIDDKLGIAELRKLIIILERVAMETKTAVIAQLPLELAIIEWGADERNEGARLLDRREQSGKSDDLLEQLIEKIKPYNHSVAGVLRGCQVTSFDGEKVTIETRYKFHKERLEEDKTRKLLKRVGSELLESPIEVLVTLKEGGEKL